MQFFLFGVPLLLGLVACGGSTEDDLNERSSGGAGGVAGASGGGGKGDAGSGATGGSKPAQGGEGGSEQAGEGGAGGAAQAGSTSSGGAGQSSAGTAGSNTAGSNSAGGNTTGGSAGSGGNASGGASGGQAGAAGAPLWIGTCADARPEGAPTPPPPPKYSGGACPALSPGANTIKTSGDDRKFLLVLPSDHDGKEVLPLIFLWHWLGGSAKSFLEKGQVQQAADQMRFAAVIPDAKEGTLNTFKWPYSIAALPSQVEDELRFFDDMLGCVSEQVPIQSDCVASMGVSAGALWTDQLAGHRGEYLSSIISLSGGVGGPLIKPWIVPDHKMPAYVLWGGSSDVCVTVQFEQTSKNLQQVLTSGGHFQVECVHNCAHAEPPLDPIEGFSKYTPVWRFFLEHPFWLSPGASPWNQTGLPPGSPSWCSIGVGQSTQRTGECPEPPSCPL